MQKINDKKIVENINEIYCNLIRDKNDYVIESNFDYLKENNLLCILIFRWSDYIGIIAKKLSEFVKKRNEINITRNMNEDKDSKGFNPESRVVKPKEGTSDTAFIYAIMKNTDHYQENTNLLNIKYDIIDTNCNTFSNCALDNSGADSNRNKNFNGIDWGKNSKIDFRFFEEDYMKKRIEFEIKSIHQFNFINNF